MNAPQHKVPIRFQAPAFILQEALNIVTASAWNNSWDMFMLAHLRSPPQPLVDIEHYCALVIHPVTGKVITSYKMLTKDPITREIWMTGFGKEFGSQAQGDNKTNTLGTNSICYPMKR